MLTNNSIEEMELGKEIIAGVTIEDFGDCLEEPLNESPELNRREPFSLSINFFDISSNIKLLRRCQPVRIKLVDCKKFPHYFRNCAYIKACGEKGNNKSDFDNLGNNLTVTQNCEAIDEDESYADFVKNIISLQNTMAQRYIKPITDNVQSKDVQNQYNNKYKYIKPKNQYIPLNTSPPGSTVCISNYKQKQFDKTNSKNKNMNVYSNKDYDNMVGKEKYFWTGSNYYNIPQHDYAMNAPYPIFNQVRSPFPNNNTYYTNPCYPNFYRPYPNQYQAIPPPPPPAEPVISHRAPYKNNITENYQAIGVTSKNYSKYNKQFTNNIEVKRTNETKIYPETRQLNKNTFINCSEKNYFPESIRNDHRYNNNSVDHKRDVHKNFVTDKSVRSNDILNRNPELKKILDTPPILDNVVKNNVNAVTGEHNINNTGYSSPILPIPTYEESYDVLAMPMQKRKMNFPGSESIPKIQKYY